MRQEQWTEDRNRRADAEVLLENGTNIPLEAQRKLMTDDGWRQRHLDYVRQGVVDVWFWRPRVHFPHIMLSEGLPVWFHSLSKREAATSLGHPHRQVGKWWKAPDLSVYAHWHYVLGQPNPALLAWGQLVACTESRTRPRDEIHATTGLQYDALVLHRLLHQSIDAIAQVLGHDAGKIRYLVAPRPLDSGHLLAGSTGAGDLGGERSPR
ncbi:hypothetical protein [Streptomyces sp. NPDC056169]|uniref:hypothetical protein n=1 Tax=Streptomyces sp. NPDC056169 TaxID=3345734 RepID=UPI0035DF3860